MEKTTKVIVTVVAIVVFIIISAVITGVRSDAGYSTPGFLSVILLFALIGAIRAIWNIFSLINGVEETRWYVSDRAIFGKFPVSVSPCLKFMDADKVHHYLTGALELENDGSCIKTKR